MQTRFTLRSPRTDLGFTRDRHYLMRKSAKADLRARASRRARRPRSRASSRASGPSFETAALRAGPQDEVARDDEGFSPPLRPARERVLLLAQRDADRHAGQVEAVAQSVGEVAQIGVRYRIGAGAEEHETRRPRLRLGHVDRK